jgi:hypothetical protein
VSCKPKTALVVQRNSKRRAGQKEKTLAPTHTHLRPLSFSENLHGRVPCSSRHVGLDPPAEQQPLVGLPSKYQFRLPRRCPEVEVTLVGFDMVLFLRSFPVFSLHYSSTSETLHLRFNFHNPQASLAKSTLILATTTPTRITRPC